MPAGGWEQPANEAGSPFRQRRPVGENGLGRQPAWAGLHLASSALKTHRDFGSLRVAMKQGSEPPIYLYGDHLGSMTVWTTDNGTQEDPPQTYYAYGSIRSGSLPTDYGFTGQKQDSSSALLFYGSRYYASDLGRFVQPDSIIPDPYNPQDLNRYAYGLNNPLRYKDRSGHIPIDWLIAFFSVCFDVQQFVSQPTWENAGWLAADVVFGVVPYVPAGVGPLAKGAKLAGAVDKSADAIKMANRAQNVAETAKAVDAGVAAYRGMRDGGIHSATTGKAFSDWFKVNILKDTAAKGKQIFEGARRLDIVDEAGTLVKDGSKQIYELKNYTDKTSIGSAFWSQADDYNDYAKKSGYTLNYVFGQKIGDDVAEGLIERDIKVWYIDDLGKMQEWIP